jgi:magnesium-transporting ATPase (P-type)
VPMIQAAQVGIGIAGREGALSLANGDFWGWWFYMILWLIVVNGWWRMDNGWWLPGLVNIEKKLWNITIW